MNTSAKKIPFLDGDKSHRSQSKYLRKNSLNPVFTIDQGRQRIGGWTNDFL